MAKLNKSVDRDNKAASRVGVFLIVCYQHCRHILLPEVLKNDSAQFPPQCRLQLSTRLI